MYYVMFTETESVVGFESLEEACEYKDSISAESIILMEVQPLEAELSESYEDMDGDHASALASAGWGTDEDYDPGERI